MEDAPIVDEYVPAGQETHLVLVFEPVESRYVPTPHNVQFVFPKESV
jgi:hypothetical protein